MIPKHQGAENDLGSSEPLAFGRMGRPLEQTDTIFDVFFLGFQAFNFLLMGFYCSDLLGLRNR